MTEQQRTPEEIARQIKSLIEQLEAEGRRDLLLKAVGVPLLEELRIEAAKGQLSRLVITKDYRFILEDYHREVELQPVHKAVYLLFHIVGSSRIWYERLKVITLPRNLVVMESEM